MKKKPRYKPDQEYNVVITFKNDTQETYKMKGKEIEDFIRRTNDIKYYWEDAINN